jgi:hypothetical protein
MKPKKKKPVEENRKPANIVPALYLGERVTSFGDIVQSFRVLGQKERLTFTGIRNIYAGEAYEYDLNNNTMKIRPARLDCIDKMTEADEREFELHKELAKHRRLERQKAMNLKKPHRDIVRAIDLLRPFCRNASTLEIRRFTEYLGNQLSKKPAKRK